MTNGVAFNGHTFAGTTLNPNEPSHKRVWYELDTTVWSMCLTSNQVFGSRLTLLHLKCGSVGSGLILPARLDQLAKLAIVVCYGYS